MAYSAATVAGNVRTAGFDQRSVFQSGDALRLTFAGGIRFEVDPMHRDMDIEASEIP